MTEVDVQPYEVIEYSEGLYAVAVNVDGDDESHNRVRSGYHQIGIRFAQFCVFSYTLHPFYRHIDVSYLMLRCIVHFHFLCSIISHLKAMCRHEVFSNV